MTIKVKEYHPCDDIRPKMHVEEQYLRPHLFRKAKTKTRKVWALQDAKWTCPECKSEWEYRGAGQRGYSGYWLARTREHYWVEVPDNYYETLDKMPTT